MKFRSILFLLVIVLFGCKGSKSKEKVKETLTEAERKEEIYKYIEDDLSYQIEKITLLSEIRKISYDTLFLILRDYYALTEDFSNSDNNSKDLYKKVISSISANYHVSKPKIASLIFSFKYEMLTKEDIEESAIENMEEYEIDERGQEPEDPY